MTAISIRGDSKSKYGIGTIIEIDGVDVANAVTRATLSLRPDSIPTLEIEFLGIHEVTQIGGVVEWIAYADGQTASGSDIPTVLRDLAAKIENAR